MDKIDFLWFLPNEHRLSLFKCLIYFFAICLAIEGHNTDVGTLNATPIAIPTNTSTDTWAIADINLDNVNSDPDPTFYAYQNVSTVTFTVNINGTIPVTNKNGFRVKFEALDGTAYEGATQNICSDDFAAGSHTYKLPVEFYYHDLIKKVTIE